jgi:cell division protein FtsI/penicillin-binding protein 2
LDSLGKRLAVAAILIFLVEYTVTSAGATQQDLHTQAAAAALAREFPGPDLSYILLDEQGVVMAQRWDNAEAEIPVGSLTKPFMAVAYGRTHESFPQLRCTGKKTCWLPRGHGLLRMREAIAYSCNSYFHQLVARAGPEFPPAMEAFALRGTAAAGQESLFTTASPLALSRAYLELTRAPRDPSLSTVLQGLALSARKGTASAVGAALSGAPALAKTGTAPCTHRKKAPGDGFALVMFPAEHPREVLLVRLHGRPGFMAAGVAGRMIARVEGMPAAAK